MIFDEGSDKTDFYKEIFFKQNLSKYLNVLFTLENVDK